MSSRISPVPWLAACLGLVDKTTGLSAATKTDLLALSSMGACGDCIHEDGGKFAILESTEDLVCNMMSFIYIYLFMLLCFSEIADCKSYW